MVSREMGNQEFLDGKHRKAPKVAKNFSETQSDSANCSEAVSALALGPG